MYNADGHKIFDLCLDIGEYDNGYIKSAFVKCKYETFSENLVADGNHLWVATTGAQDIIE